MPSAGPTRPSTEAQRGHDPKTQARALETRSLAQSFSGRRVDLELAARSLTLHASIDDQKGLARSHNVMGLLSFGKDEWVEALEHYTGPRRPTAG